MKQPFQTPSPTSSTDSVSRPEQICMGFSSYGSWGALFRLDDCYWSFLWDEHPPGQELQWACYPLDALTNISLSECDFYLVDDPLATGKNRIAGGRVKMPLRRVIVDRLQRDPLAVIMELML